MRANENIECVELAPRYRISKGSERTCYVHPQEPSLCIKVENPECPGSKQQKREKRYFGRLKKRGVPWVHTPAYYGTINTTMGKGLVFSAVRDYDGSISSTLGDFVDGCCAECIRAELEKMKSFFFKWSIVTCDMSLNNFLVQWTTPEEKKLVMIDGLGTREFIPLSQVSALMSKIKMRRRWRKFDRKLERFQSS
jgi:hypothetical protein